MRNRNRFSKIEIPQFVRVYVYLLFILLMITFALYGVREVYSYPVLHTNVSNEKCETVKLRVVKKGCTQWELRFGFSKRYYLVLSNGLGVVVTEDEYDAYHVDEEYEFDLTETTTVEQRVVLKK